MSLTKDLAQHVVGKTETQFQQSLSREWHWKKTFLSLRSSFRTDYFYHITYGPGVPEHSAGNNINALVQYRFLFPRFSLITLLQTGHK